MSFSKVRLADFVHLQLPSQTPKAAPRESPLLCAWSEQYIVERQPLSSAAAARVEERPASLQSVAFDHQTRHALASFDDSLLIWRQNAANTVLFPLNSPAIALFCGIGTEPGLLLVEQNSGAVLCFRAVAEAALGADTNSAQAALPLRSSEYVEHVEQLGRHLFAAYTKNRVFVISVCFVGPPKVSIALVAEFRDSIVSVRSGRDVQTSAGPATELLVLREGGDLCVYIAPHVPGARVSPMGSFKVRSLLEIQTDQLLPPSSLQLHDAVMSGDEICVLASAEASRGRVFLLARFFPHDPDGVSVREVQSAFGEGAQLCATKVLLKKAVDTNAMHDMHDVHEGTSMGEGLGEALVITTKESLILLDPSRRFEECFPLRTPPLAVKSGSPAMVGTAAGFLTCRILNGDRRPEDRLLQPVFLASETNPLDLCKWQPAGESPQPAVVDAFAQRIAGGELPFHRTGSLSSRAELLERLYFLTEEFAVRELAQMLAALVVLEREQPALAQVARTTASAGEHAVKEGAQLLAKQAENWSRGAFDGLLACSRNGMGMPHWATCSPQTRAFRALILHFTHEQSMLAESCELLCAFTAAELPSGANNPEVSELLVRLAEFDARTAADIAARFRVYSALAKIEIDMWTSNGGTEECVVAHITEFGDVYASAVFDSLISRGSTMLLVSCLAPRFPNLAEDYLSAHGLHWLAWTLSPGSPRCAEHLRLAVHSAKSTEERVRYAALYKLAAQCAGLPTSDADELLALGKCEQRINEITNVTTTITTSGGHGAEQSDANVSMTADELSGNTTIDASIITDKASSAILKHCRNAPEPLSSSWAVDVLALTPAVLDEAVLNLQLAFAAADYSDEVRTALLVQQAINHTDWIALTELRLPVEQSLFCKLLSSTKQEAREALLSFENYLHPPAPEALRAAYPWDLRGVVGKELGAVCARSRDIAEKFGVRGLVDKMRALPEDKKALRIDELMLNV